jgi:hypothetical protein
MREMNLAKVMRGIVFRCNRLVSRTGSSIELSLPPYSSKLFWQDRSLEKLLERVTVQALSAVEPGKSVRIAVRQRKRMRDLEKFFEIQPSHWIQLRIARRGPAGLERDTRRIMEDLGYCCEEWIGANGSWPQLGAFSLRSRRLLKLLVCAHWHNDIHKCELLIPVIQPSS